MASGWQNLKPASVAWEGNRRNTRVAATGNKGCLIRCFLIQARRTQEWRHSRQHSVDSRVDEGDYGERLGPDLEAQLWR